MKDVITEPSCKMAQNSIRRNQKKKISEIGKENHTSPAN